MAHYLANAGVLVASGEIKVVFDPLFRNDYGRFRLVPAEIERALFAGDAPFDGLDAVFVSHYHSDHFSAEDVLRLLRARPELRLFAPEQAVSELRVAAGSDFPTVSERIESIALAYRDDPVAFEADDLKIEAVRIPHSGWPDQRLDVENLAFRVTLGDDVTVVHLGDADTTEDHYTQYGAFWRERSIDAAFPPYWYFPSESGRAVLRDMLRPAITVGVHVPADVPEEPQARSPELRDHDLFTRPGETRAVPR